MPQFIVPIGFRTEGRVKVTVEAETVERARDLAEATVKGNLLDPPLNKLQPTPDNAETWFDDDPLA